MKFLRNSLLAGLLVVAPLSQANAEITPNADSPAWTLASNAASITGNLLKLGYNGLTTVLMQALKATSFGSSIVKKMTEYPKVTLSIAGVTGIAVLYKKHINNEPHAITMAQNYLKQIGTNSTRARTELGDFLNWVSSFEECPELTDVQEVRKYFNKNMHELDLCHCAMTSNETARLSVLINKAEISVDQHINSLNEYLKNVSYINYYCLTSHMNKALMLKDVFLRLSNKLKAMKYTASQVFGPATKYPQQGRCASQNCVHVQK